ncbi:MAG: hypothetical protein ABIQ93_13205, partial [Saprospiraceae bacterium]
LDDQMDYLDSMHTVDINNGLPLSLRTAIRDCEAFLFLGFDFENWYFRVLFHFLKVPEDGKLIFGLPASLSKQMGPGTQAYFQYLHNFSFYKDESLQLLAELRKRIAANKAKFSRSPEPEQPLRKLLYLHARQDDAIKDALDHHLSLVKKRCGLDSESIHDFAAGTELVIKHAKVDTASVVLIILSADYLADKVLADMLTQRALARRSSSVCVATIYARPISDFAGIFQDAGLIFPAEMPLSMMPGEEGYTTVVDLLTPLIDALP